MPVIGFGAIDAQDVDALTGRMFKARNYSNALSTGYRLESTTALASL